MPCFLRKAYGTTLIAPDWLTMPTGPSIGSTSLMMVENVAIAPLEKLAMPCVFGPTMRMPEARALRTISSCACLPASPVSPKPEVITTATFTPRLAHAATAATAPMPGTATIARSGASGIEAMSGYALRPWMTGRFGLTGKMRPWYPARSMYLIGRPPIFSGFSEAPITATDCGFSAAERRSSWMLDAVMSAPPMPEFAAHRAYA